MQIYLTVSRVRSFSWTTLALIAVLKIECQKVTKTTSIKKKKNGKSAVMTPYYPANLISIYLMIQKLLIIEHFCCFLYDFGPLTPIWP
jgi:hypothetical protein